jgi:hypothetical protein
MFRLMWNPLLVLSQSLQSVRNESERDALWFQRNSSPTPQQLKLRVTTPHHARQNHFRQSLPTASQEMARQPGATRRDGHRMAVVYMQKRHPHAVFKADMDVRLRVV